jgi:hypothetical protein
LALDRSTASTVDERQDDRRDSEHDQRRKPRREYGDEQANGIGVEKREARNCRANRGNASRVIDAAIGCPPVDPISAGAPDGAASHSPAFNARVPL